MVSGIGVTPFSGTLADLQARADRQQRSETTPSSSPRPARSAAGNKPPKMKDRSEKLPSGRTWDMYSTFIFHWIVKDRNHLLRFSDLLNTISESSSSDHESHSPNLNIQIRTHVTQRHRNITTHIFRYLLETHRTAEHPTSPLTGLLNPTHYGRPCLATIMENHYKSMQQLYLRTNDISRRSIKVGVFFCGPPVIGYELADRCRLLTLRGREYGALIEYHFMMEVFR
jgi:dual oxidase